VTKSINWSICHRFTFPLKCSNVKNIRFNIWNGLNPPYSFPVMLKSKLEFGVIFLRKFYPDLNHHGPKAKCKVCASSKRMANCNILRVPFQAILELKESFGFWSSKYCSSKRNGFVHLHLETSRTLYFIFPPLFFKHKGNIQSVRAEFSSLMAPITRGWSLKLLPHYDSISLNENFLTWALIAKIIILPNHPWRFYN